MKDNSYELGQLYRDPSSGSRPADAFRSDQPKDNPSQTELDLKASRAAIDGYDIYGVWDGKMRMGSAIPTIRTTKTSKNKKTQKGGQ